MRDGAEAYCTGAWLTISVRYAQFVQYSAPLERPAETITLSTGSWQKYAATHLKQVKAWLLMPMLEVQQQHVVLGWSMLANPVI